MHKIINNVPLKVKEYKGNRVVTLKDIDMIHGRPAGTAKRNFNKNMKYFIEGEDFFFVKPADIQKYEIRTFGFEVPNRGLILLTENGYLMLVKSLTDDLSWDVQRQLVNTYFRAKEMTSSYNYILLQVIENQKVLERKIDALEKQSSSLVKDVVDAIIVPGFKEVHSKIESTSEKSDRNIIRSVTENVKLLGTYINTLIKKIK